MVINFVVTGRSIDTKIRVLSNIRTGVTSSTGTAVSARLLVILLHRTRVRSPHQVVGYIAISPIRGNRRFREHMLGRLIPLKSSVIIEDDVPYWNMPGMVGKNKRNSRSFVMSLG